MKRISGLRLSLLGLILIFTLEPLQAQLIDISIEAVTVHDGTTVLPANLNPAKENYECGPTGTLIFENGENLCEYPTPELNGYTTYHIYANVTNELDFVSAVYGTSDDPLFLESTGDIFHVDGAADFATAINPGLFEFFPLLAFDSWLTIGASNALDGVQVQTTFNASSEALQGFNNANGFVVQDPIGGTWFNTYGCAGASGTELEACANDGLAFGGDDLRVLLAQVTTNGDLTGMFNVQVFPNGNQEAIDYAAGFTFSSNPDDVFGCTDSFATNFDPLGGATVDDFSCIYPCTLALDSAAFTITPPTCAGANDGAIGSAVTGQQGADYFYLDTIAGDFSNFGNFSGLLAGTYDVIVVDDAQCGDTLSVTLPEVEPLFMSASLTTPVSCHNAADGVITIDSVSGGNGDYEFAISSNPTELSSDLVWEGIGSTNGLNQTFSFQVLDGNGCVGASQGVLVTNPHEMFVSLASINPVQDASCANTPDGKIYLTALGGGTDSVGPFEFSVDGETYGPSPLLVAGGTYTVTARDPAGCTATLDEPVYVGPAPIEVNAVAWGELCTGDNNGEVSWAPTSGVGVYTYSFDGEATTETLAGGLAPGPYVVAVTDENGCTGVDTVEVEAAVPITVSATAVDASCFGANDGEIIVSAEGGTGAFDFSDDGAEGTFISSNEFGGFTAGTYEVFVRDEFGCDASGSATVGEPDEIVIGAVISEFSIDGEVSIELIVLGGDPPFTYEWIGEGVSGQTDQQLEGISTGSYTVEVTDANGCSSIETFIVPAIPTGCTDPAACNYGSEAIEDDGSCDYSCLGCTDSGAVNHDPQATVDDGSCVYFIPSCDFIGNPAWADLGPGVYLGQPEAEHEFGVLANGEFVLHVPGSVEDGYGGSFSVLGWDNLVWTGLPDGISVVGAPTAVLEANAQSCLTYSGTPFQEGVFEATVTGNLIINVFGNAVVAGEITSSFTMVITPNENGIGGCTYANASNFLPVATIDDGSCVYEGCMDPEASNFQIFATTDDGSCSYECAAIEGPCMFDSDSDGLIGSSDLLNFLASYGENCD